MHIYLKVVTEGLGGTVYIKTEEEPSRYIAEIGIGKECFAKTKMEAIGIAERLIQNMVIVTEA